MIDEHRLRTILQTEANRHAVNPILGTSAVAKARWSRVTHFAGACGVVAAIAFMGVGVIAQVDADTHRIDPAAGPAGSPNAIASGTTPGGATWTLSSAPASQWATSTAEDLQGEGAHCFGFSGGPVDGRSESCHAMPDDIGTWLHLGGANVIVSNGDRGGALYGEVSNQVTAIEITLRSGQVFRPEIIDAPKTPYRYFVAFMDPQARGKVAAYDAQGNLVNARQFLLDRGALGDQSP